MMGEKKQHIYDANILGLPPLTMVLGDVPEPDPQNKRQLLRAFGLDKSESEAKITVAKLIGHLKKNEK